MAFHLTHWANDAPLLALLVDADQVHHLSFVKLPALAAGVAEGHPSYLVHITK